MDMRGQPQRTFQVSLKHLGNYRFESQASEGGTIHGDPFYSDEPDPVGDASAPATPALLAAAIGHCLSASLLESLRHAHISVAGFATEVSCVVVPNAENLPRIDRVDVTIRPTLPEPVARSQRCADVFERHCTVTSSVRDGLDVRVKVEWQFSAPPDEGQADSFIPSVPGAHQDAPPAAAGSQAH